MGCDEPGISDLCKFLFVTLLHVLEINTRDIEHLYAT